MHVPVHSLRYSDTEKRVAERIRELTEKGTSNGQIIAILNQEGYVPCRGGSFTPQIVSKLKMRYGIVSNLEQLRRGKKVTTAYTIRDIAKLIENDPSWIYRKISNGLIRIEKDPIYGCYLFPQNKNCVDQLKRLKKGTLAHVSIQKVHHHG